GRWQPRSTTLHGSGRPRHSAGRSVRGAAWSGSVWHSDLGGTAAIHGRLCGRVGGTGRQIPEAAATGTEGNLRSGTKARALSSGIDQRSLRRHEAGFVGRAHRGDGAASGRGDADDRAEFRSSLRPIAATDGAGPDRGRPHGGNSADVAGGAGRTG